jgi:DNA replication ATP-dependent helicase Dna2
LLGLNRFNVMASRAKAKLIVLVSREMVDHLGGELDVLRGSRLPKVYSESFNRAEEMTLRVIEDRGERQVAALFRYQQ